MYPVGMKRNAYVREGGKQIDGEIVTDRDSGRDRAKKN
jgi:hypothetical protein